MMIQKSTQTFNVEYMYVLNHHNLMKIEKIHIPQYSFKSRQNDYLWRYSNFDKFWRALERARMYIVSKIQTSIWYRVDLHFKLLQFDENWRKYTCLNIPQIHVKMTVFGDIPISADFGARQSARACMMVQRPK